MQIRCLHCHDPVELDDGAALDEVSCPTCGESFKLVADETLPLAPKQADAEELPSRWLGRFQLIEQLGKGGFGTVWLARDPELDRHVAVKVPRTNFLSDDETEQFLREARAAAQLHHPNIVRVHEVGRDGDTVFIVSEFVRGHTLAARLTAQRMSAREAAEMTVKLAEALDHAHEKGVIHRDLKPGNIMVAQPVSPAPLHPPLTKGDHVGAPPPRTAPNSTPEPYIMDFGLARREAGEMTMTVEGQVLGTPLYMSPEQARGESHQADRRSDIYSLGVILYAMLTGELPFRGNVSMLVHQILNEEPTSLRRLDNHVPRDLETICLKCLHKNPERRYQRASELAADLRRWLSHEPIHARPVSGPERAWRWSRRKPWAAAFLGLLLIAFVVLSGLSWRLVLALRETVLAHETTKLEQRKALLGEAVALRLSNQPGRRSQALAALRDAAAIAPGPDLRNEYLRCLELPELQPALELKIDGWGMNGFAALRGDERVFVVPPNGRPVEFDAATGRKLRELTDVGTFSGTGAISLDGNLFAGVSADEQSVRLIDLQHESVVAEVHTSEVGAVAFNSTCDRLALGTGKVDQGSWISIYAMPSLQLQRTWSAEAHGLDCLRFGDDGDTLFASVVNEPSSTREISAWTLSGPSMRVTKTVGAVSAMLRNSRHRVDVSPNGRLLSATADDGTVKIWNLAIPNSDGVHRVDEVFSNHAHQSQSRIAQFSPDGRWMLTGGVDALKLWSVESHEMVAQAAVPAVCGQWSSSGNLLLCGTTNTISLWRFVPPISRIDRLRASPDLEAQRGVISFALQFSPKEHWLAWGADGVSLLDLAKPDSRWQDIGGEGKTKSLSFASDDALCASSTNRLRTWQLPASTPSDPEAVESGEVLCLGVNLHNQRLVVMDHDATLKVQNLDTGKELLQYLPDARISVRSGELVVWVLGLSIDDVRLSPDGEFLAVRDHIAKTNDLIRVFDLTLGKQIRSVQATRGTGLAIARRGQIVAFGSGNQVGLLHPHLGDRVTTLQGHDALVVSLSLDLTGDLLASLSALDGTLRLWNTRSGEPIAVFQTGAQRLTRAALSPSGRWLAAGNREGRVRLWNLDEIRSQLIRARLHWPVPRRQ